VQARGPLPPTTLRSWSGELLNAGCQGSTIYCGVPTTEFGLRLIERGANISGLAILRGGPVSSVAPVVEVMGSRDASGSIQLTGTTRYITPWGEQSFDLTAVVNESGSALSGRVHYVWGNREIKVTRDEQILFARESFASGAPLSGAWRGWMTRERCSGACSDWLAAVDQSMLLAQVGARVSGSTNVAAVSGTVAGNDVLLDGMLPPDPACRPHSETDAYCSYDVHYSMNVDEFERLTGTVTERATWFPETGPGGTYESTYRIALVRWP
jgi:hypothetical protein